MRQWLPLRPLFLEQILGREAPPSDNLCSRCAKRQFKIRCRDCLGNPVFCSRCCQSLHEDHPFHRIEIWSGTHFSPAWLWQIGLGIHLGHGGKRCPANDSIDEDLDSVMHSLPACSGSEEPDVDDSDDETMGEYGWSPGKPPRYLHGARTIVIVHTNGVHHLPIWLCSCLTAPDPISQYLQMGFYPATYKQIETVFSFQVLDDYRIENLECQTSYHHYYSKLRRLTNSIFPENVPVRCLHLYDFYFY